MDSILAGHADHLDDVRDAIRVTTALWEQRGITAEINTQTHDSWFDCLILTIALEYLLDSALRNARLKGTIYTLIVTLDRADAHAGLKAKSSIGR